MAADIEKSSWQEDLTHVKGSVKNAFLSFGDISGQFATIRAQNGGIAAAGGEYRSSPLVYFQTINPSLT